MYEKTNPMVKFRFPQYPYFKTFQLSTDRWRNKWKLIDRLSTDRWIGRQIKWKWKLIDQHLTGLYIF